MMRDAQQPAFSTLSRAEGGMIRPQFLRAVLAIDAATCLATGALMAFAGTPLGELTALPSGLLTPAGLSLFPIAAFLAWLAWQARPPGWGVWLAILGNLGWVAGSLALLLGVLAPNGLGVGFVLAQAAAVAVLAGLEWAGLQRRPA